jgi:hypothetical protein
MRTVEDILRDLLKHAKLKNSAALARELKVKPSTVSTWKKRGTIDYTLLVAYCEQKGIPSAWVLTGQVTVKQQNIDGQEVIVPSSEPGLYRQDKFYRTMMEDEGILPAEIRSPSPNYNVGRPVNPEHKELVNKLLNILESDDTVMKVAITENLKAFSEGVERKNRLIESGINTDFKLGTTRERKNHVGGKD